MTWRTRPPESRVWALCVVRGFTTPIVMQWDPPLGAWIGPGSHQRQVAPQCLEWHPLPSHPAFDPVTHAVEPDTRHVEDELRAQIETMQANAAEQMHCKAQTVLGAPCPKDAELERLREAIRRVPIDEIADRLSGGDAKTAWLRATLYELREAAEENR